MSECICDMLSCGNSFQFQKKEKKVEILTVLFFSSFFLAIWTALKMLGYRTYHFKEIHKPENLRDKHLLCWREAFYAKLYGSGKPYSHEDFYKLLQRYDVSSAHLPHLHTSLYRIIVVRRSYGHRYTGTLLTQGQIGRDRCTCCQFFG